MIRVLAILLFTAMVAPAAAQFVGPGQAISVGQVSDARLGADVTVVGNIVGSLGDGYYTFRDESGEIRVEIDRSVWRRRQVDGDTLVQLTGEVERDRLGRYLDIETMVILP